MTRSGALDFMVRRDDLRQTRLARAPAPSAVELGTDGLLVRVEAFALTANNVSYALTGDLLGYWNFFPAPDGWGRIPAWGFGAVIRTRRSDVAEGERLFGYFPMSSYLAMQAAAATPAGLLDASPHRKALPAVYNLYTRVSRDPAHDAEHEDEQMLLWPLFMTAFLLDDFLAESDFFGARTVVLCSASSKTAIGLAHLLAKNRGGRCDVVGLTSKGNVAFVEGLGCYDRVLPYEELRSLPADRPSVIVDMAGDREVLGQLHRHLGEQVKYSCLVGATHWERGGRDDDLPGANPTFFFAPSQLEKRAREWGAEQVRERTGRAWRGFVASTGGWLRVVREHGPEAVEKVYREVLEGRARPERGHVLSLGGGAAG